MPPRYSVDISSLLTKVPFSLLLLFLRWSYFKKTYSGNLRPKTKHCKRKVLRYFGGLLILPVSLKFLRHFSFKGWWCQNESLFNTSHNTSRLSFWLKSLCTFLVNAKDTLKTPIWKVRTLLTKKTYVLQLLDWTE